MNNMQPALMPGVLTTLQNAQTTGNGTAIVVPPNVLNHCFYIAGTGTVSAGAVTVETAHDPAFAGTWSTEAAAVTVVSGQVSKVTFVGVRFALRARVSTDITGTGGNVTVQYLGNVT